MNPVSRFGLYAFTRMLGPARTRRLISAAADSCDLDLLSIAYNRIGILNYADIQISGEYFLVAKVLKHNLRRFSRPVIFDVGANVGRYAQLLANEFPEGQIYAFEPNVNAFSQLADSLRNLAKCVNVGMGAEEKTERIFTYADNLASSHASAYEGVFHTLHKRDDLVAVESQLVTLDSYCDRERIARVNFLKIDTEGNEINVLRGARKMLATGGVDIIQFEFGECDVFSRVFLKDIYAELSAYNIYRLASRRLIPLFEYNPANEIFRFQNFVAVNRTFPFEDVHRGAHPETERDA